MGRKSETIVRVEERVVALDRILQEREKQVTMALNAAQRASDKSQQTQEQINVASNEWRGSLRDAQDRFPSKTELSSVVDRVVSLETRVAGSGSVQGLLEKAFPILISLAALAAAFWKH